MDFEAMMSTYMERKKGNKKGKKPITKDFLALLNSIPRDPSGFIFLGHKGQPIKTPPRGFETLPEARDQGPALKDLRWSGATMLMEKGTPMRVIQADLGHTKVTTTELFLHVRDQIMRKELEKGDGYCSGWRTYQSEIGRK